MGNNYNLNIWESLKAPYFISRSPSGRRSISKLGLSKHSIDRVFGIFYCGQDNLWAESNFYRRNFPLKTIFSNLSRMIYLHVHNTVHKHTFKVLLYLYIYCFRTSTK